MRKMGMAMTILLSMNIVGTAYAETPNAVDSQDSEQTVNMKRFSSLGSDTGSLTESSLQQISTLLSNDIKPTVNTEVKGDKIVVSVTNADGTKKDFSLDIATLTNGTTTGIVTDNTTKTEFDYYGKTYIDLGNGRVANKATNITFDKNTLLSYSKPEDLKKQFSSESANNLNSNNDDTRRDELEKLTGISLSETPLWGNHGIKEEEGTYQVTGSDANYTSVETLKSMGSYSGNASRQELIAYAIENKDWQPYRLYEYQQTPAYFALDTDSKLEYSKVFYANLITTEVRGYRESLTKVSFSADGKQLTPEELAGMHKVVMADLVASYKNAKGPEIHVAGLNDTEEYRKAWGTTAVPNEYFESPYNDPQLLSTGNFSK